MLTIPRHPSHVYGMQRASSRVEERCAAEAASKGHQVLPGAVAVLSPSQLNQMFPSWQVHKSLHVLAAGPILHGKFTVGIFKSSSRCVETLLLHGYS